MKPIYNWKQIDDKKALVLIKEIIVNLDNEEIIERNSEGLEKKYGKTKGTISDLIFIEDITDPNQILSSLKKQNIIYL